MNIVVTGSSSGIGRALTQRLLQRGHSVWGLARRGQEDFAALHSEAFRWSRCDLSNWSEVERVAADILRVWPVPDGLVCCAGAQGAVGPALQVEPTLWSATVRANLDATYFALRALAPSLRGSTRRGKIICLSGGGATKARPRFAAYGSAKTGIVRLVETLSEEEKDSPFDINALAPGAIATAMTDEVITAGPEVVGEAEYQAALRARKAGTAPLERALDCAEWMLSAASDGISGRLISAQWDPWESLGARHADIADSEIYTLRRITPAKPAERDLPGSKSGA